MDASYGGTPGPGGQLADEAAKTAAIKRLQKQQQTGIVQKPGQIQYSPNPPKPKRY